MGSARRTTRAVFYYVGGLAFGIIVGLSSLLPDNANVPGTTVVPVAYVIDGDTIKIMHEGALVSVRLAGIDAPELRGAKCDHELTLATLAKELVEGLIARNGYAVALGGINLEDDKHGRWLARVYAYEGVDLSQALLEADLARVYDGGTREGWCDNG